MRMPRSVSLFFSKLLSELTSWAMTAEHRLLWNALSRGLAVWASAAGESASEGSLRDMLIRIGLEVQ